MRTGGRRGVGGSAINYVFRLLDKPAYIYVIAIALWIGIWIWKKDWSIGLLVGYMFLVFAVTILTRETEEMRFKLDLFWSWRTAFRKWPITPWRMKMLQQILLNIAMFIPIGFLLGRKVGWKAILIGTGYSLIIEITQLVTHRGLFEIDDLIHNTAGAAIGFGLCVLMKRIKRNDVR